MNTDPREYTAITDKIADAEAEDTVFGKRWGSQVFRLSGQDLEALRQGKYIALDIQSEYIAYLACGEGEKENEDKGV